MPMKMHFLKIDGFERGTWNHRIGGVNWTLEASIHTSLDQHLAIKLWCNKKNISPIWKCSASIRLALLTLSPENRVSGEETVLKIDEFDFSAEENVVEALELKKMCDLACRTNRYLSGDVITLVLEIFNVKTSGIQNIPRVEFTKPDFYDTILEVDGTKLYIPSQLLVFNSQFFRSMLSVKSEGVRRLENLKLDEFLELLNVIYNRAEIQKTNVRRLLKLASRFDVPGVVCRCEKVLIREETIDVWDKLMLAEQHGLAELQSHCLHSLQAPAHFRVLTADPRHAKFTELTRQAIIRRMIAIMEKTSADDDSLSDSIDSDNSEGLLADHIAVSDVVTIDLDASEDDDSSSEDVEKRVTFGDVVENQMTFVGGVDDTIAMFDTFLQP